MSEKAGVARLPTAAVAAAAGVIDSAALFREPGARFPRVGVGSRMKVVEEPAVVPAQAERSGVGGSKARRTRSRQADGKLAGRIANGDERAFGELYDRLAGLVMGLARRQLGEQAAEEIVQETFARMWRRASTYSESRGSLTAWVRRIGRNLAIDELRRRGSRPVQQGLLQDLIESIPDPGETDPSEGVWRSNMRMAVRKLWAELPVEQREVLGLAYMGGMSQSEIARRLELPLGTVKSRTRSALYKLKGQMAKKGLLE